MFTNAFTAGWMPQAPFMVGLFTFMPEGSGTRYRAGARHGDEAAMKQHEEMGFTSGWGQVAEQLAEIAESMAHGASRPVPVGHSTPEPGIEELDSRHC